MNAKVVGISLLLVLLFVFLSIQAPHSFLTGNNIENVLRRTAMYGILGIGVAFVIITAGIDLSIGSMVCLTGCLLAIFLHVDYAPFDEQRVLLVDAAGKRIVLPDNAQAFGKGDRIRYYGGRRARNQVLSIADVRDEMVPFEGARVAATVLIVDQPLTNDDRHGRIARVYPIHDFFAGDPQSVTFGAGDVRTSPRDQLALVHPDLGLKQLTITSSRSDDGRTVAEIDGDLGSDMSGEWLAVPMQRRQRMPVLFAIGAVLLIAVGLGAVHGLLVTKVGLQPFVVTLCGLLIYRGISRQIVNDQVQGFGNEFDDSLSGLASGKIPVIYGADGTVEFGIPIPFLVMVVLAVLAAVFLNRTVWGRYMLALGRNEAAARYSGIHVHRVTIMAYVICTVMAAIGGILFALDSNSVSPSSFGNFFELYAIAAAVLGGCSLRGGEGGILGVVIGTAVMQTLNNLIVLVKISDRLEFAIIGGVILAGVMVDELVQRVRKKKKK